MLLPVALFVLFLTGCWLYSLTDAGLTPAATFRGWSKLTWLLVISCTYAFGAIAWLVVRRRLRGYWHVHYGYRGSSEWTAADEAFARHPAGRSPARFSIPRGPDDDPEFLAELARRIHGNADTGDER
jgi:hypothetical protein